MKITEATSEQKIKALAEMDGWKRRMLYPAYTTSYDAIINLINKPNINMAAKIEGYLNGKHPVLSQSPEQLADLLLVLSGRFEP